MTSPVNDERPPIRVVLADANVLSSHVLRDHLLYAAMLGVLEIRWSAAILAEVVEHLGENVVGFDAAAGARLVAAMNGAFPAAEVEPDGYAEVAVADSGCPTTATVTSSPPRSPSMPTFSALTTSGTSRLTQWMRLASESCRRTHCCHS